MDLLGLAVWEYQAKHGELPASEEAKGELTEVAERKRVELGVNEKALQSIPGDLISYVPPPSSPPPYHLPN
jgi:hypothetical protein